MTVIDEIAAERRRQIETEGWSAEHDDTHTHEEMAQAAAMYALPAFARNLLMPGGTVLGRLWPWDFKWWKPEKRRRNLIKAAALLVAEIERLDRFEAKKNAA